MRLQNLDIMLMVAFPVFKYYDCFLCKYIYMQHIVFTAFMEENVPIIIPFIEFRYALV